MVRIPTLTAIDQEFKTPVNGVGFAILCNRVKSIMTQLIPAGSSGKCAFAADPKSNPLVG